MSGPPPGAVFWVETLKWFVDHLGPILIPAFGVMAGLIKIGSDAGKRRAQKRVVDDGDPAPAPPVGNEWAAFADRALHGLQEQITRQAEQLERQSSQITELNAKVGGLEETIRVRDRLIVRLRAWIRELQRVIHDHEVARNLPLSVFAEPDDDDPLN